MGAMTVCCSATSNSERTRMTKIMRDVKLWAYRPSWGDRYLGGPIEQVREGENEGLAEIKGGLEQKRTRQS